MCVYVCACVYIDQTPTPTRFLRNVEESGLFQELADNPFDQVQQLLYNSPLQKQQKGHLILV